jgi:hypothetical protein
MRFHLLHEPLRSPDELVGVKGGQGEGLAADTAVFARVFRRRVHLFSSIIRSGKSGTMEEGGK